MRNKKTGRTMFSRVPRRSRASENQIPKDLIRGTTEVLPENDEPAGRAATSAQTNARETEPKIDLIKGE